MVSCLSVIRGTVVQSWSLGARSLSAVRNQEASARGRLIKHYFCSNFNWCHSQCPLQRGCSLVRGSVMGGSTVCHWCGLYTHKNICEGQVSVSLVALWVCTAAKSTCCWARVIPLLGSHSKLILRKIPSNYIR